MYKEDSAGIWQQTISLDSRKTVLCHLKLHSQVFLGNGMIVEEIVADIYLPPLWVSQAFS